TLLRGDLDPPAHSLDEATRDEEAEPAAACPRVPTGRVRSVELAKDPLLLALRDPDALVDDLQLDGAAPTPGRHGDRPPARRVFHGLVDERAEDRAQLLAVGFGR